VLKASERWIGVGLFGVLLSMRLSPGTLFLDLTFILVPIAFLPAYLGGVAHAGKGAGDRRSARALPDNVR
jgi:hypothetical protein